MIVAYMSTYSITSLGGDWDNLNETNTITHTVIINIYMFKKKHYQSKFFGFSCILC